MLELLATNTIYNALSPGSPIDALTIANGSAAFYDDGLGLCSYVGNFSADIFSGGYSITQLDGATYLRSYQSRSNAFAIDMQRPEQYIIHASLFEDALYLFNKGPGTFGDLVISTGITADMSGIEVRAADRYLSAIHTRILFRPLDLSLAYADEAAISGAGSGRPTWSRTRNPDVLALVWETGEIAYYDVVAGAQAEGSGNLGANVGAWYSRKHDVFIAITAAHTLKVFASAPRPSSLSNPVAVSPLTQGRVSQVRVRLLGSSSDACAGELVNWSISAGAGELVLAQSETDADGYAYNDYVAPASGGAGSPFGSVTIEAQVLF